jgi:hypothetical protein
MEVEMRTATALLLSLVFLAFAGSPQPALAVCALDQQQPIIDPTTPSHTIGGASNQKLAQTFAAGVTGELCELQLTVACSAGDLTIAIHNTVGGVPGNTVLAQVVIPGGDIPPYGGPIVFRSFTFPAPPTLTAGIVYAIVLTSDGDCSLLGSPFGDTYASGNAYFIAAPNDPNIWVCVCDFTNSQDDIPFKTFIDMEAVQAIDQTWGEIKNSYR